MDFLQNLQSVIGQGLSSLTGNNQGTSNEGATATGDISNALGGLGKLLNPALLGGLAGALLSGKRGGLLKGALLAGGGAYLWDKYQNSMKQANANVPGYGQVSPPDERAQRLVRALVYAAKSDGHIDDTEKAAIAEQVRQLKLGQDGEALVRKAMDEPLDPAVIAKGVKDPEEALQLFTLSCAVLDIDQFMEKNYLDALGIALNIPPEVRTEIQSKLKTAAAAQ